MKYQFIAIEGCIGAGKTTLARKISEDMNRSLVLEEFEDNPLLPQFYKDPSRYALSLELYFTVSRFQQLKNLHSELNIIKPLLISDFLFQKSLIFASHNLHGEENRIYNLLFDILYTRLPVPDLIVYLYLPVDDLLANIRKRGRPYEQNISPEYLKNIQGAYLDYFKNHPDIRSIVVDISGLDFLANPADYQRIKEMLCEEYPPGMSYQ